MKKKAIIIGAGPAGLTAAYYLLKETDIVPVIYEASDDIGGISRTAHYMGNRIDIGGHRFFTKNEEVMKLWTDLMPVQGKPAMDDKLLHIEKPLEEKGSDPETNDQVMLVRNRVSRIYYLKSFFDYPISLSPRTIMNMGLLRTMKAGFGYIGALIKKREEKSLADFYINRFGKPLYEMFFKDYTAKLWGIDPSEISPDWGAQRVKGLSLKKAIADVFCRVFHIKQSKKETSLIEQFYYPKYGPGQLWETLAIEVERRGGEIIRNAEITGVKVNDAKTKIEGVSIKSGNETSNETADYYFSSMPVKDLVQAMGSSVPEQVSDIATKLPYRDFITVGLLVDKLALKNNTKQVTFEDRIPDCWIYIQERDVKVGRLQIFNNWSPYMVNNYKNTMWLGMEYFCEEGDSMWNMKKEEFISFAISEMVKMGILQEEDVLDSTYIQVKKAYPAYFGSYAKFDQVESYLNQMENLYCIGRNGQHRYNNMDHSMLTAMEAVKLVKSGNKNKESLWNVNVEQSYHENKEESKK
ncbi:NAD(P)/FAD-dependent oxidoreductase [Anaeromicropila populeti]|uniref:Protoporphyrinogen oxidase n=1 Tax=Anaeromicropila populeti TaxID=37658 RepID=A0A1I6JWK6_9FIRM|nr:NAD(P)/FAD-dependent oxidoreductase [Anaeromicropila populeti]SFR83278.1 Protoporphyrinogen oxidase [Anaeromicropila populeti]